MFVFLFLLVLSPSVAQAQAGRVESVSVSLNAGMTRLVIEADRPVLASLGAGPDGLSLQLKLINSYFSGKNSGAILAGGVVSGLHLPAAGATALSIDLLDAAIVDRAFHLPPQSGQAHRLVIDLLPADPADYVATFASPVSIPLPDQPPPAQTTQRTDTRKLIVLDPGHGGHDPGAVSATGRYEKELTLAFARIVAQKLRESRRYRVVLTRDKDHALKLQDRIAIARKAEADLFISIHADSLGADRQTRGASVYVRAQDATDREAEALALRENRADQIAETAREQEVDDVVAILVDLASRDTERLSRRFAGLLTASLSEQIPLRRNALRAANFRVLGAPDIPSALLELGYLSNPSEEALLFSEAGREKLAAAVVVAIDRMFAASAP